MRELRVGDIVSALAGSVASMWAEGRLGVIVELRDPKGYSGNDSNNLIKWEGDTINLGFRPCEVRLEKRNG